MKKLLALLILCGCAESTNMLPKSWPEVINTKQSGTFTYQTWQYEYTVFAPGTRSESASGILYYDDKLIMGKLYDSIVTPWGIMCFFGIPESLPGMHPQPSHFTGWLLNASPLVLQKGRRLTLDDLQLGSKL